MGNQVRLRAGGPAFQRGPRESYLDTGAILLCYGSCPDCGWWCALPEGGTWPDCANCGTRRERMLPERAATFEPHLYEQIAGGQPKAFVARFMLEREALKELTGRDPLPPERSEPEHNRLERAAIWVGNRWPASKIRAIRRFVERRHLPPSLRSLPLRDTSPPPPEPPQRDYSTQGVLPEWLTEASDEEVDRFFAAVEEAIERRPDAPKEEHHGTTTS